MKKLLKWLFYMVLFFTIIIVGVLAAAYYNRDVLLKSLSDQLNKGINGKLQIEKVDFTFFHHFPHFSITLHNVFLRDTEYDKYSKDVFSAKKIFVDLRLYPLLKKEIVIRSLSIDDADIFIFKTKAGYTNSDVFKTSNDSNAASDGTETSVLLNLQKIGFRNVAVVYSDSVKNKSMSFRFQDTNQSLLQTDSGYTAAVQGQMHFGGLLFNAKTGSFLSNKDVLVNLDLTIHTTTKSMIVHASTLKFKKNEIGISGKFDLRKEGDFSLTFTSKDIYPEEVKELLNSKLVKTLSKFESKSPVTVVVALTGKNIPGSIPSVDIKFQTRNATLRYGPLDFSKLDLEGTFSNHIAHGKPYDNQNSQVKISSFKGNMEKLPVKGRVSFTELQDPRMDLSFTSKINHKDVNDHFDNSRFVLEAGDFTSEVTYKGKLAEYLDPTRTTYKGKLNGKVTATNAALYYKPKKIRLDKIQLGGSFNEKNFTVDSLNLRVNGSSVSIKGSMQNFIPFFIRPKNKGYVKLSVTSPNMDLTGLTSKRESGKKTKQQVKQDRKKMTDLFDMVYEKLEFDVQVNIEQLTFRKFKAMHFTGHVNLDNSILKAHPVTMQVANGTMNLNFLLTNIFEPVSRMTVEAKVNNADIKSLFLNFNNFNQKTIHADNLNGSISANAKFNAHVNDSYSIVPSTMKGTLECRIVNGALKNFEPMENMSNFLFKKRDFSDIQFAELYSNFSIQGTEMDIGRMEIQSSVVSLFLQGRYSFSDSTSLSVQLPLSNLKKRHKDFKPQNIGTHAKAGPSVYLHVYRNKDINSKIQIDYDPFKKWAKN